MRTEIAFGLIIGRGDERVCDEGEQFGQMAREPCGEATVGDIGGREGLAEARDAFLQTPTSGASGRGGIVGRIMGGGREAAEPIDPVDESAVIRELEQKISRGAEHMCPTALLESQEVVIGGVKVGDENAGEVRAEDGIDLVFGASACTTGLARTASRIAATWDTPRLATVRSASAIAPMLTWTPKTETRCA